MHNWKDLGLKTEYLVVTTRISSIFIMEFFNDRWTVVNSLNNIHTQRKNLKILRKWFFVFLELSRGFRAVLSMFLT